MPPFLILYFFNLLILKPYLCSINCRKVYLYHTFLRLKMLMEIRRDIVEAFRKWKDAPDRKPIFAERCPTNWQDMGHGNVRQRGF